MPNDLVVVDISHWQSPDPNFEKMKEDGIVGVILKATEGTAYTDDTFATRYQKVIAADLKVSSYHFLKPGNAEQQMDFYYRTVNPEPGERMVIDYEDQDCDLDDLRRAVAQLSKYDVQVTVYGANGFLGAQLAGKRDAALAETSLWVASYTTAAEPTMTNLKGTWPVWSLWQYSDEGSVDGYSGPIDANRFNGSAEACAEWMGPLPATPLVPLPEEEIVVTLTIESTHPVRVVVNQIDPVFRDD